MFVIVDGEQYHSGTNWRRQFSGICRTSGDWFNDADLRRLEQDGDMMRGSGEVTHFIPWCLPRIPLDSTEAE
jgi:hypothetical protein